MNDLELFPSEEQINMMNKEYNELKRRQGLVCNGCGKPPHNQPTCNDCDKTHLSNKQCNDCEMPTKPPKHEQQLKLCKGPKCGTDLKQKKLFERIYFAEQDLIMALRQLYTIAPIGIKDDISDIIKLKKTNSSLALKCYYSSTDSKLSYSPVLSHEEDYCKLLRHIITMQKQLLLMLGKAKFLCVYSKKMIQNEWTVSYILTTIGMCCKF